MLEPSSNPHVRERGSRKNETERKNAYALQSGLRCTRTVPIVEVIAEHAGHVTTSTMVLPRAYTRFLGISFTTKSQKRSPQ